MCKCKTEAQIAKYGKESVYCCDAKQAVKTGLDIFNRVTDAAAKVVSGETKVTPYRKENRGIVDDKRANQGGGNNKKIGGDVYKLGGAKTSKWTRNPKGSRRCM